MAVCLPAGSANHRKCAGGGAAAERSGHGREVSIAQPGGRGQHGSSTSASGDERHAAGPAGPLTPGRRCTSSRGGEPMHALQSSYPSLSSANECSAIACMPRCFQPADLVEHAVCRCCTTRARRTMQPTHRRSQSTQARILRPCDQPLLQLNLMLKTSSCHLCME